MNLEDTAIVLGLAFVIWLAGYHSLAVLLVIVFLFVAILMNEQKKPTKAKGLEGVKISGPVEVLEPIVIETRRTPPFRIPSKTYATIQAKGYKDIDRERYTTNLFYPLLKIFLAMMGRRKKD